MKARERFATMAREARIAAIKVDLLLEMLTDEELEKAWAMHEASKGSEGLDLALVKGGKS